MITDIFFSFFFFNPPGTVTIKRNIKNQEKCLGNQQGNRTYYLYNIFHCEQEIYFCRLTDYFP